MVDSEGLKQLADHQAEVVGGQPVPAGWLRGDGGESPEAVVRLKGLADHARETGLAGLQSVYEFYLENLGNDSDAPDPDGLAGRLSDGLRNIEGILRQPDDYELLAELANSFQDESWPSPLSSESSLLMAESLLADLESGDAGGSGPAASGRPDELADEDLLLAIPDDVDREVSEAFLSEAPQQASQFSECMQRLLSEGDLKSVIEAQRVAHTIKGSANITGVPAIANLMHFCEDILEHYQENQTQPPPMLKNDLMVAADTLESMVEFLNGSGPEPEETAQVLRNILKWANAVERGEDVPAGETPDVAGEQSTEDESAVRQDVSQTPADEPVVERPAASVAAAEANESYLRIPTSLVDNLLRISGEISISNVQLQGSHDTVMTLIQNLIKQNTLIRQRLSDLQDLVELKGVPSTTRQAGVPRQPGGRGGAVSHGDFDPLEMDEYNELHSVTNALAETLVDAGEISETVSRQLQRYEDMLLLQDNISRELNDRVLGARMVPVDSIAARLRRIVRQTARTSDKQVEFTLEGAEIALDSAVLNNMVNPLMHLLRNAIDHGIEYPGERAAANKPEQGNLEMQVRREGDSILFDIRDDGRGFDFDRIRTVGLERGLLTEDESPGREELIRLTLVPGFSTRGDATHISGRGIGMDVVYRTVLSQSGVLDIESDPGAGTRITIKVPLTLISMHALILRAGPQTVGVPSSTISQLIFSDGGKLNQEPDGLMFEFEGDQYRVTHLSELMGAGPGLFDVNGQPVPMLLVQGERDKFAVALDDALDSRYLIVKKLGAHMPSLPGVIGASILADGGIAPILDVREMLRVTATEALSKLPLERVDLNPLPANSVLVVDDSLSARRNLAQLFEDAGYEVSTAIDGLDAIDRIDERMPSAVLLDMEMPRMNGLELAVHLRSRPETSTLPLVMITSRSTARHREQAQTAGVDLFVTKPYSEESLLTEIENLVAVR